MEYAVAFSEFMALSSIREERQIGSHIIPAQFPNWSEVLKMGNGLLEKSRDLRILVKVCRAALHKYGLPGLAQGVALMALWIENDWNHLYPKIELDGDSDPLFRSNVISEISDREGLVSALRQAVFLETPIGAVTVFTAEQMLEGKQDEKTSFIASSDQLSRILVAEKDKNRDRLAAISSISSSLASIDSVLKTRLESEYWPNIDLLAAVIGRLDRFVASQLQEKEIEPSAQTVSVQDNDMSAVPKAPVTLPPALNTRADAYKALALAREYFERHEPSHPAPLLIRRVERIGNSDFMAIIQELMPDAISQAHLLAGER